ncbi:hypothetical protein SGR_3454 [Streptomyces griseus subsp. griseus NBRC 13350]|uniref:Uncharacterized protein n=1 Tax=Streptomyces griseus subsp. griseus (strain JCM 4626 / CBS 651.72 / NBRC 13350 / KCC S-0626 / ISP 5235) TaxID=455632 RepID=B1VMH3_STRGG|nr:hypothetical protein SGR_3454 [Streptomyces griseus subsp. griseus NBRC 13350]
MYRRAEPWGLRGTRLLRGPASDIHAHFGATPNTHATDPHGSRKKVKALITDQGLHQRAGDENRARALSSESAVLGLQRSL